MPSKTKRRVPAHQPEPRGRRGHPVIEEIPGLHDWLVAQQKETPRPTIVETINRMRATAFWIELGKRGHKNGLSASTVSEFYVRQRVLMARRDVAVEFARQYNAMSEGNEPLALENAVSNMALVRVAERIEEKTAAGEPIDEEMHELIKLVARLSNAGTMRSKAKHAIERGLRATERNVRTAMELLLKNKPHTLRDVLAALEQAIAQETE